MLCSFVSNEQIKQDFFAILLIEYMYIYDKIVRTRLVTHTHKHTSEIKIHKEKKKVQLLHIRVVQMWISIILLASLCFIIRL